jgi:O-antigen/teichoic acid export membrane protein
VSDSSPKRAVTTLEPKPSATQPRGRVRRVLRHVLADDTLSQKASLNMLAAVLDYAARVVVGLLINPILVSRLGDAVFGVYQVLGRLIGYATPAGGRPSQALKWTIAYEQRSTRYEEKRLQVGSAVAVWFLFLPFLVVAGGLLAWFAPLLVDAPESLHLTIRIAAGVLVLDLIAMNLLLIPQSVVQGENLGYKRMGLTTFVVFLGGGLAAAAAILGWGLVGVTASVLAVTLLTGVVFWRIARTNVPWFGIARPDFRTVLSFVRLSGWFLLWNLVMQLMRGSDVVVLGIVASTELVTVFALSRYVPEAIFGAVAIVVSAIMPGLGGLIGARDTEKAVQVRAESMSATWLIATACGAALLVWQESFLGLWVGEEYYPGLVPTLLIVLMVLQFAFIRNDSSIIDLTLKLRGKVVLGFISAGVSIGLAVLLLKTWEASITALAVGFIAGRSILTVAYPWLVCRYLEVSPFGQLRSAVRPMLVSALAFAGAALLAAVAHTDSWLSLLFLGGISVAAFGVASFFLGLSAPQRRRVSRRVQHVLRRT